MGTTLIQGGTVVTAIEKMEAEGIVGPSDGTSRPREVFINKIGGDE